jgi:tetratricopeptide (TPR) repeat protein
MIDDLIAQAGQFTLERISPRSAAYAYYLAGRYDEAIRVARRLLTNETEDDDQWSRILIAWSMLRQAYAANDGKSPRLEEVKEQFARAARQFADLSSAKHLPAFHWHGWAQVQRQQARLAKAEGKTDDAKRLNTLAVANYRKALAQAPAYGAALNGLAHTLLQLGDFKEAEIQFRHAIEHRPRDVRPYIGLAETLQCLGNLDGAREILEAALPRIEIQPDSAKDIRQITERLAKGVVCPARVGT